MNTSTITYSSELMKNYKQAEVMSPEEKFEALQTNSNHALLFSIGTDKTFYVTQEISGHDTGWEKTDLSTSLITQDFANQENVICKTFEVAQNIEDGSIGIAMVINDTIQDYLYLCLGNSNTDMSWLDKPNWISFPYDDSDHPLSSVIISNVFISETSDNKQYIVVDSLRDPDSATQLVYRHYIDTEKSDGCAWCPSDLPFDLEADSDYASCLGRQKNQTIDGLYTFGQVDGEVQFIYQPLYNVWSPDAPPTASRLNLPNDSLPEAMAPIRNSDDTTDLYVSYNGGLYYFESSNQTDNSTATLLFSNDMFNGVRKLFAFNSNGNIIIWGLNANDEIFYTSCSFDQIKTTSSWTYPLPILTSVDMVSPYVNKANNGNTFFAVAGDELVVVHQCPNTTTWKSNSVTLPALDTDPSQKFSSYTTRIQVNDENDQPICDTPISISSLSRVTVYINHLYYILDTTPITVNTDQLGSITIIEWVDNLSGTQLTIQGADGESISINPMDKPFNKITELNSKDSLKDATITYSNDDTKPLVNSSTSNDDLQAIADGNQQLSECYTSIFTDAQTAVMSKNIAYSNSSALQTMSISSDDIVVAAGDLYNWLKTGVESVIEIVLDTASNTWHFIATIAGQVYRAVLDTVETIVGAIEWVFNAIETLIEDLIAFLEFLFEWADITRTKDVIKNLTHLFLKYQVDSLNNVKDDFDNMITDTISDINNWAGIDDWTGLGDDANAAVNNNSEPSSGSSSSTNFLSHHFENNAGNITISDTNDTDSSQDLVDILLNAINQEGEVLGEVISQLNDLANTYGNKSLLEILNELIAILVDGVLESAQVVIDALLDLLIDLGNTVLDLLSTAIHIPVISDILNDFGVEDISLLDLFCWLMAVPSTLLYKLVKDKAPFPDNDDTSFLINASDYQDVAQAFDISLDGVENLTTGYSISSSTKKALFITGHSGAGFCKLMSAIVTPLEAAEDDGGPFSTPSTILGITGSVLDNVATTMIPNDPLENSVMGWVSEATFGLGLLNSLIFCGPAQSKFAATPSILSSFNVEDSRATAAIIDAILIIPALCCTTYHFYELTSESSSDEQKRAIIEETASITSYIDRVSYTVAVNVDDPETKGIAIGIMALAKICDAGLQQTEAFI